jgi:hypothetical protein
MAATKRRQKARSRKHVEDNIFQSANWTVVRGRLVRSPGRPRSETSLFEVVAEKILFAALNDVQADAKALGLTSTGIYLAHDSMGVARYAGRGDIFSRLRHRQSSQKLELTYFSFYIIPNKNHQREVETLLIRAASNLLFFNERKKRETIEPGSVYDYEAGTKFYERQWKRGRRNK